MPEEINDKESTKSAQESGQQLKSALEKTAEEREILTKLESIYPPDQQQIALQRGEGKDAAEVIVCGAEQVPAELKQAIQNGVAKLEAAFGATLDKAMPGLKIYLAGGVIESGGLALGKQNAIILDLRKNLTTTQQAEAIVTHDGFPLNPGDWVNITGDPTSLMAETELVHEVGHILDEKIHGHSSTPTFDGEAPTKYGASAPQEDYAESFLYYVYGQELKGDRAKVIAADIRKNSRVE